jgi:carbon monoxide dehydrogenase subunit G
MRIEETFSVGRPPEAVFDYMTNPANLAAWQTSKTFVEPLNDGPTRRGSRFREGTKPPLQREFVQVVEFTSFARPRHLHVHIVEGPFPVDGDWSLDMDGAGTRVRFVAEGELRGAMRLLQPVAARMMARQFAAYHRNLRRNVEGGGGLGA